MLPGARHTTNSAQHGAQRQAEAERRRALSRWSQDPPSGHIMQHSRRAQNRVNGMNDVSEPDKAKHQGHDHPWHNVWRAQIKDAAKHIKRTQTSKGTSATPFHFQSPRQWCMTQTHIQIGNRHMIFGQSHGLTGGCFPSISDQVISGAPRTNPPPPACPF